MVKKKDTAQRVRPQDNKTSCVVDRWAALIAERITKFELTDQDTEYSVRDLHRDFPNDETIIKFAELLRWPGGVRCPRCDSHDVDKAPPQSSMPYYCRRCRKEGRVRYFSVTVGTHLEDRKLAWEKLIDFLYFVVAQRDGISGSQLATYLRIDRKTARDLRHKLQKVLPGGACHQFLGPTEVDESYLGGSESNRHKKHRRGLLGRQGKAVVLGAVDRATGHVRLDHVERADAKTVTPFVRSTVALWSRIYTDGQRVYRKIAGYVHDFVEHSKGEFVRGDVHINSVESLFGRMDLALYILRGVKPERLQGYLHEIQWRCNLADRPLLVRMAVLLSLLLAVELPEADSVEQELQSEEAGSELVASTGERAGEKADIRLLPWAEDDQAALPGAGERPQRTAPAVAAKKETKGQRPRQPVSKKSKVTAASEFPQPQQLKLLDE